jgi:hypothetical protein
MQGALPDKAAADAVYECCLSAFCTFQSASSLHVNPLHVTSCQATTTSDTTDDLSMCERARASAVPHTTPRDNIISTDASRHKPADEHCSKQLNEGVITSTCNLQRRIVAWCTERAPSHVHAPVHTHPRAGRRAPGPGGTVEAPAQHTRVRQTGTAVRRASRCR